MKSLFAVLLTACLCMSVKGEDSKPPRTLPGGWVYVWGDEFNGSRIDAKKWKPELGVIRNQGSQQTYTGRPKNMRLEDGCLVLESKSRVDVRIVVILCAFPVIHQVAVGIGGAVNRMLCNQHACFYIAHYMTAGIDKHEGKIKTFIT